MFGRPLIFVFVTLTACGGAPARVLEAESRAPEPAEEGPAEEAAQTVTLSCDEAEAVVVPARSQEEMRAMAVELTLAEAATPALVVTHEMPRLRGRRFYVYEDTDNLGVGQRCAALPGVDDDVHELLLRVNGPRDSDGVREYHEILAGYGITETGGGSEGPGFGTAFGDARSLDHRLVRADAEHRIYASGVTRRHLACRRESRSATCPGGGEASCTAMAPAVISTALSPSLGGFGSGGVGSISSTQCQATCEETECAEALGDDVHRTIRQVYEPDASTLGIFRSRGACRAYARERAPLLPRIAAATGECDCERCERSDDESCFSECEAACEERNEELLNAPELTTGAFTQVAMVTSTQTAQPAAIHANEARARIAAYRVCAQEALDAHRTEEPFVAWHAVRWTIDDEGRVGHQLQGEELPESLGHGLEACLAASAQGALAAGEASEFAVQVRMLLGAAQPSPATAE
ncbi:MAG: hypothetical protein AB8H86_19350 [Polyangiales bacterium]